ncbi:MAG: hypothetical protein WA056_03075 [Gallionella sp.]
MALSDKDVQKHRNKRIVIEPFIDKHLTPAGYDLTLGYAILLSTSDGQISQIKYREYDHQKKTGETPEAPSIFVPGKSDVLILTKERVHLSGRVLAQVHARSGIAAKGFILNPLTVDPNYGAVHGRLTLRMFNFSEEPAKLSINERIATLVLHTVETETAEPPETRNTELTINKYHHIPHVQENVNNYLDFYDNKPDDEGQKKFDAAVLQLKNFRKKSWLIREFITLRESLSGRVALAFAPIIIFDLGILILNFYPSLILIPKLPAEAIPTPTFLISVFAVNLSYFAFLRSLKK